MKITLRIILLAAIAGFGFWLWTVLFPSPEKIVLKKINNIAATATVDAADNNLVRAGKAVKLAGFFSLDAEIVINVPGVSDRTFSGRQEIKDTAMGGLAKVTSLKVQFFDTTATVGPDKHTADVNCTMRVDAGSNQDFGVQELRFQFKKIDGDWLITRVETVQTLK